MSKLKIISHGKEFNFDTTKLNNTTKLIEMAIRIQLNRVDAYLPKGRGYTENDRLNGRIKMAESIQSGSTT